MFDLNMVIQQIRRFIRKGILGFHRVCIISLLFLKRRLKISGSRWPCAFTFGWLDIWQRYNLIKDEIESFCQPYLTKNVVKVLDVGGANRGGESAGALIGEFLNSKYYDLYAVDLDASKFIGETTERGDVECVQANGACLPFKDNSLDVVISADTLEHIPKFDRRRFCEELKRVSKRIVILHVPADSANPDFQGTFYDNKLLDLYQKVYGRTSPGFLEHFEFGLPKVEEVSSLFPGCMVKGNQNGEAWLKYMKIGWTPILSLFSGLIYNLFFKEADQQPPYRSCLLTYQKSKGRYRRI